MAIKVIQPGGGKRINAFHCACGCIFTCENEDFETKESLSDSIGKQYTQCPECNQLILSIHSVKVGELEDVDSIIQKAKDRFEQLKEVRKQQLVNRPNNNHP